MKPFGEVRQQRRDDRYRREARRPTRRRPPRPDPVADTPVTSRPCSAQMLSACSEPRVHAAGPTWPESISVNVNCPPPLRSFGAAVSSPDITITFATTRTEYFQLVLSSSRFPNTPIAPRKHPYCSATPQCGRSPIRVRKEPHPPARPPPRAGLAARRARGSSRLKPCRTRIGERRRRRPDAAGFRTRTRRRAALVRRRVATIRDQRRDRRTCLDHCLAR